MPQESIMQITMDSNLKVQVANLYQKIGTSFAEAVRIFAKLSVEENAMPFAVRLPKQNVILGIANGKYVISDNIAKHNDEIAAMFSTEK